MLLWNLNTLLHETNLIYGAKNCSFAKWGLTFFCYNAFEKWPFQIRQMFNTTTLSQRKIRLHDMEKFKPG